MKQSSTYPWLRAISIFFSAVKYLAIHFQRKSKRGVDVGRFGEDLAHPMDKDLESGMNRIAMVSAHSNAQMRQDESCALKIGTQ